MLQHTIQSNGHSNASCWLSNLYVFKMLTLRALRKGKAFKSHAPGSTQ